MKQHKTSNKDLLAVYSALRDKGVKVSYHVSTIRDLKQIADNETKPI